jgi:hypothetical protein
MIAALICMQSKAGQSYALFYEIDPKTSKMQQRNEFSLSAHKYDRELVVHNNIFDYCDEQA